MNWISLHSESQLTEIEQLSYQKPVVIFKHSTRCSISSTALNRFERHWDNADMAGIQPYHLDLLAHRPVSAQVARTFAVEHQSPQILLIRNGKCVYTASHWDIAYADLKKQLAC